MNDVSETLVTQPHEFTLLTNHTHVLVLIAQKPDVRMREIAATVGITERAVQRIVDDLTSTGYIIVTKDGRRNRYEIQPNCPMHHPLARHRTIGDLIRFVYPQFQPAHTAHRGNWDGAGAATQVAPASSEQVAPEVFASTGRS
jgi:DNA-binding IscR family transcriptional regulator